MALRELTVSQFLSEVLKSMGLGRLMKSEAVSIVFKGWGSSAPIEFQGSTLIDRVFAQLKKIEHARPSSAEKSG